MKAGKSVLILYGFLLLVTPAVLLLLPPDQFDSGRSICLSQLLLNIECYGCGMTRGIQHLLHGDLMIAMQFNKLSVAVLPVLIFLWCRELIRVVSLSKKQF